jgi:hypothetical protein
MALLSWAILLFSISAGASLPLPGVAPSANDRAEDLLGPLAWSSLELMESHGRLNGSLPDEPWSGYSWPTYRGGVANRYADPAYRPVSDWAKNNSYLEKTLGQGDRAFLSPAEKYDLLVGAKDFPLARASLSEGARVAARDGGVATWFGICHGWAPASVAFAAPVRPVTLPTPAGGEITFTAEDIRALASLLWAKGKYGYRLIGGRCEEGRPKLDRYGRPANPDCLDTNPATWHLAVVNSIGLVKPLLLDNTFQEEVWNSPVYSYRYVYRRPGQAREYRTLAEAARPISAGDRLRKLRAPGAVALVEVRMVATIVGGHDPARLHGEIPKNRLIEKEYRYELELGEGGEILGGEWRHQKRPDFVWVLDPAAPVSAEGDRLLAQLGDAAAWEPGTMVPESWREAARGSATAQQPLARIVNRLVEWSR